MEEKLRNYYDLWIDKIANNYTIERILSHLNKHLEEKITEYHAWITSADNLKDIYYKVKGADKEHFLIHKYEKILKEYEEPISVKDKLMRLLRHYMCHPDKATPPPTSFIT
jgi:hypothetical protein